VVRSGATEFSYDRSTQPRPKIDPWRSDLDEILAENARQPKRQRLTLVRVYEELRNRGYRSSQSAGTQTRQTASRNRKLLSAAKPRSSWNDRRTSRKATRRRKINSLQTAQRNRTTLAKPPYGVILPPVGTDPQ